MFKHALVAIAVAVMLVSPAMADENQPTSPPPDQLIVRPGEPKPILLFIAQYWNNDDPWKRMEEERQYREKQEQERQVQQQDYERRQRDYESQQRQNRMDQIQRDIQWGNPSEWQLEQYKRDMQDMESKRNSSGAGRMYDPAPNYNEHNERDMSDRVNRQVNEKQQEVRNETERNRYRTTPSYEPSDNYGSTPSTSPANKPVASTIGKVGDVLNVTVTVKGLGSFSFRHTIMATDTSNTILTDLAQQINKSPQLSARHMSARAQADGIVLLVSPADLPLVSMTMTADAAKPADASSPVEAPKQPNASPAADAPKQNAQEQKPSAENTAKKSDKKSSKKAKKEKRNLAKKVLGGIGKIFRRHTDE